METEKTNEPTVIPREETSLAKPHVPTDVNELAALEVGRGVQIVEQRTQILETLRVASIKLTMPNDWTLFKSPEGVVTGFLGDQGCDRVKKLWGIQVNNLGRMEEIRTEDSDEFAFRITGDGVCGMTGEAVFEMEGVRYSTEPYAQQKPAGLQRVVAVQKAARANLDGGITRELTGLKSVPLAELENAWKGTGRTWNECNKGRGFGSGNERQTGSGSTSAHGIDAQDIPECDVCKIALVWRPGKDGKEGFFGCKNWASHKDTKVILQLAEAKKIAERKQAERDKKKATAPAQREPGADDE